MKISYLITCSTETTTLENLLNRLISFNESQEEKDEIVVLNDATQRGTTSVLCIKSKYLNYFKTEIKEIDYNNKYRDIDVEMLHKININNKEYWESQSFNYKIYRNKLNNDYGKHKNYGNSLCNNEWICQIDGDENISEFLLVNLKDIINENTSSELIYVPRINDFKGVREEHAKQWGWRLTKCEMYNNRLIVNWPDYQGRIYKNIPDRIKWTGRLHERITGHNGYTSLPAEFDFAFYHDKHIDKQIETNLKYNELFTTEENQGHSVFNK